MQPFCTRICLLVVIVFMAACAGGSGGLGLATPGPGQQCSEPVPIDTIAPADLFDEAAILAAVPSARSSDPVIAVFSFSVDSTAHLSDPRLIGGSVSAAEADALRAAVADAFRDWTPQGRIFGARLRVEGGASPRLAFHTRASCAPEMTVRTRRRAGEHLQTLVDEVRFPTTLVLHVFIDEAGRVDEVRLMESPGNATVNESVTEFAKTLRFHPLIIDGKRTPGWVQIPFTVRPRAAPVS